MTNSSNKGKSAIVNPYTKRPVISNPYTKKAASTVKTVTKVKKPANNNNAASNKKQSYKHLNRAVETVGNLTSSTAAAAAAARPNGNAAVSRSKNPYAAATTTTKAVTPTPKKKQIPHKHIKPSSSSISKAATSASTGSSKARVAASSYTTPKAVNRSIPNPALLNKRAPQNVNTTTRITSSNRPTASLNSKPQSLKQSLKSQIAQIKRRKQLLLQQKEADKLRKQRQIELQKVQRQRQREAQRLLRQQQRQAVECTIDHIVSRVEQRMELEEKCGGVHYSIGEVVYDMIGIVERTDLEERRLIRERKARLRRMEKERKVQVRQCLSDVVEGVERRVYGVHQYQQQQMQQQQMQMMAMKAQQQQQQHYNYQSINPHLHYAQQGVAVPHYGAYYPMQMQMQMPANIVSGYPMQQPAAHHYHNPNGLIPHPQQHTYAVPSSQTLATKPTTIATTKKPLILSAHSLTNPHSPYLTSHQLVNGNVCVMKKEAKDSFGVTLRYESKSVLVARVEVPKSVAVALPTATSAGVATTAATTTTTEKKPRRKRETFGVLSVVEATKARFASQPNTERKVLQPGDIILSINGRDVGGMTFAESCRFISTSSSNAITGEIRCVLTVARRKVPLPAVAVGGVMTGTNNNLRLPHSTTMMQPTPPTIPLIAFSIFGEKVIGDFSSVEWCTFIRSFPIVSRALTTGMALLPVSKKDVCVAIKEKDAYKNFLNQRSVESMQAKMAFEGKRIEGEVKQKAEEYWKAEWEREVKGDADNENNSLVENYLTDAQRSILRSKARPTTGCKCGSKTHTFVSDPKCVLFRDVKQFCAQNSINVEDEKKKKGRKISTKGKGKLEAAYIRRFNQLREETAATKEEAEFVLKMEQNQCFGMKKAVFAPSSLCTAVLSAVAAVMDRIPKDRLLDPVEVDVGDKMVVASKPNVDEPKKPVDSDEDDSDSDDEDMPLNALLKPQTHKRAANNVKLPSPKRPKQTESSSKAVPSAYILGEILLHISKTYGHLFLEPSHPNYAWQQRHRSVIKTPLPKEVMFAGNPRKPGTLSFENVRFVLTEERLARLKNNWLGHDQLKLPPQPTSEEMEQWSDEWTITHLSSDAVTGIAHEIDVLENLGILKINQSGSVVLAQGWERRVPHMTLNEMKDAWGSDMDVNNLHCIHEKIRSSLEDVWQHDEDEWRFESEGLDDDDAVYEDEEYELRRQIFLENYDAFVNSRKGVGEFGI